MLLNPHFLVELVFLKQIIEHIMYILDMEHHGHIRQHNNKEIEHPPPILKKEDQPADHLVVIIDRKEAAEVEAISSSQHLLDHQHHLLLQIEWDFIGKILIPLLLPVASVALLHEINRPNIFEEAEEEEEEAVE